MKHPSDFNEAVFRRSVDKALARVRTILDLTRQPRLAHEDEDHKYEDKFALAEFLINTGNAAKINALERLGLDTSKFQQVSQWVHNDHKSVTLRFQAEVTCSFDKEEIVELHGNVEREVQTTVTKRSSIFGMESSPKTETISTKVITKVKEHHWKVGLKYRLFIFKGSDPNAPLASVELDSRTASSVLVTAGGQETGRIVSQKPDSPIPSSTVHPPIDINLTWLFQQVSPKDQLCQFYIDRTSDDAKTTCKTPRRNKDVDDAIEFDKRLCGWAGKVADFFYCMVEDRIIGKHNPTNPSPPAGGDSKQGKGTDSVPQKGPSLRSIDDNNIFVPAVPLMENGSVLTMGDLEAFLKEHNRSIDEAISNLSKSYPPRSSMTLISIAEATIVLASLHFSSLTRQSTLGLDYVENMLKQQLVKAIGKEVSGKDFDEFMRFYNRKFFGKDFAPRPFTYAIRRPNHYPDGVLSIERNPFQIDESNKIEPIETWVRHVPGASRPPLLLPINAATTVELRGDCFLHGWMQHTFESSDHAPSFELTARARQFSSFMLIVGTMMGPDKMDPKHAIILQNKDEVLIPLLTETLPSAKEFRDSISSLSPEQQEFAKAFRAMQLESSVFAVCVIQLKPQLERLLNLPDGSLTKEIQLTQDLMSLFIEYQIPSDLLSFDEDDGPQSVTYKVTKVKGYVKSVMDVIDSEKKKQLKDEAMKADMRGEVNYSGPSGFPSPPVGSMRKGSSPFESSAALPGSFGSPRIARMSQPMMAMSQPMMTLSCAPPPPVVESKLMMYSQVAEGCAFDAFSDAGVAAESAIMSINQLDAVESADKINIMDSTQAVCDIGEDFTAIPKILDAKLEQYDTDNALRSTIVKTTSPWTLRRQMNLLTAVSSSKLSNDECETEKKKAFDLLDAISRSGTLPIECSELHVIIAVSHCFENDIMGTIVQDNCNPIAKVEKSSLMIASTIHGIQAPRLLASIRDTERLTASFPALMDAPPS